MKLSEVYHILSEKSINKLLNEEKRLNKTEWTKREMIGVILKGRLKENKKLIDLI